MRLIMSERRELHRPEVTIAYSKMTSSVKRVADFVRAVEQNILCKKDNEEYLISASDIFYLESVDKRTFIYCETAVYQSDYRLYELEAMLSETSFVRVSKSTLLNVDKIISVKTLVNSRLEASLTNGESICVTRKYLKNIKEALLGRNG